MRMRWFTVRSLSKQKKIEYVNIALLTTFGLMALLQLAVSFIPGVSALLDNYVLNIILSQSITILPFVILFIYCGTNVPQEIKIKKISAGSFWLTVLLAFLIQPVLRFVNALSLCFTDNQTSEMILEISETIPFPVGLLLVAVLPAMVEEIIFRGAVYRSYRNASPGKAVLLSAFLFGLLHGNLNQFMYAFVMGIIFAFLIEASGSIVSSMIVHFITNAVSICSIYLLPRLYDYMKMAVELYKEMGMEEMLEYVEYTMGDMSLSSGEWMRQMLAEAEKVEITFGDVLLNFLPSALIFGTLSWIVIKTIARKSGNWDRFRVMFLGVDAVPLEKESKGPYDTEMTSELDEAEGDCSLKILSIPLMVAIAVGAVMMFVFETIKLLPQMS